MFLQNQSVSYGQTRLSPMDKPGFLPWPRYSRVFGRNRATNASNKPSNSQCFCYVLRAQFVRRRLKPTNNPPAPFIRRIDCFSAPAILRLLRLLEYVSSRILLRSSLRAGGRRAVAPTLNPRWCPPTHPSLLTPLLGGDNLCLGFSFWLFEILVGCDLGS